MRKPGSEMTPDEKAFDPRAYWEKRLSEKWGLHGVGHISYGKPYNEWLYRVRERNFLRHVRKLPVGLQDAVVLDIGSGTGFWLSVWSSLGVRDLEGSDLTRVAVEGLRRENPRLKIRELDITDTEAVSKIEKRFDFISAFDVLFHVTEEDRFRAAIRNVAALLRPNGYLLFTDCLVHKRPRYASHEVDRTLKDFVRELDANGLQVLSRTPVFVLMNTPIDLPFQFPQRFWRLLMSPVHFLPVLGHLYGALLYPFELSLTQLLREGPTTEMVICQKQSQQL